MTIATKNTEYLIGFFLASEAATKRLEELGIIPQLWYSPNNRHISVEAGETGDLFNSCYVPAGIFRYTGGSLSECAYVTLKTEELA